MPKSKDPRSRIGNFNSAHDLLGLSSEFSFTKSKNKDPIFYSDSNLREYIDKRSSYDPDNWGVSTSVNSVHSKSNYRGRDNNSIRTSGGSMLKDTDPTTQLVALGAQEWAGYRMQSKLVQFNLEIWWSRSNMRTRVNTIFVVLLFAIMIMHLIVAVIFIRSHFRQNIKSPYVCDTAECQQAAKWLTAAINTSVDPCDNFYEFMCGRYQENEMGRDGKWLSELITKPAYKVELLSNFHNDPAYDQPVRFYQACLNEPIRERFGVIAFLEQVEVVFGTRDFSTFESISLTMEEIGANMLRYIGEASYINFAFYTYPYIMILRPSSKIASIFIPTKADSINDTDNNQLLVNRIFHQLIPMLEANDSTLINDSINGLNVMSTIVHSGLMLSDISMSKNVTEPLPLKFVGIYTQHFKNRGLCPPMGIQLDIEKVFQLFIRNEFRLVFFDVFALKYFRLFKLCFAEDPSNFNFDTYRIVNPKTAFVSTWLFSMFWDFLLPLGGKSLMEEWKISKLDLPTNPLVRFTMEDADQHIELRCMLALCSSLGFLPSIRFLASVEEHPEEYLIRKQDEIQTLFQETFEMFSQISSNEIDINQQTLGKLIFGRGLHVDILMPLVNGMLNDPSGTDKLIFGEDHLKNFLVATEYTVERARQNWLGSTDTSPNIKWWGYGEPNIQHELFDIRFALSLSAEFVETKLAANKKLWAKFLRRPLQNYILLPLTVFLESHVDEALFIHSSRITVQLLRTFYSLLENPFNYRYAFLHSGKSFDDRKTTVDWTQLIFYGDPTQTHNRSCALLLANTKEITWGQLYKYFMDESSSTGDYTWNHREYYLSMLAWKQTLKLFRNARENQLREPINWATPIEKKKFRTQRQLSGKLLEKYSEEQLLFMAYVRNNCRGSWKTHDDDLKERRYYLEVTVISILMQMQEFSDVWKCKNNSFMSNLGKPRCIQ